MKEQVIQHIVGNGLMDMNKQTTYKKSIIFFFTIYLNYGCNNSKYQLKKEKFCLLRLRFK